MKDKEMIEEMRIQRKLEMTKDVSNGINGVLAYEIQKLAEHLISLNYVKLSKDSVVLSREEFEKKKKHLQNVLELSNSQFEKVVKENEELTDREITKKLKMSEYFVIQDDCKFEMIPTREDIKKETAEKIYLQAKAIVDATKYIVQGREYLHIDALKEIIKSCDVEIKE